jgi:thymidylate synthase (FAD)
MKLIKPKFEILDQGEGLNGVYRQIEKCGRVCYPPDTEVLTDKRLSW